MSTQAPARPLTMALSKGRIFEETLPLLAAAGVQVSEDPEKSRKLIIETSNPNLRLIIVRASDVPTYVEYGAADLGIAPRDADGRQTAAIQAARASLLLAAAEAQVPAIDTPWPDPRDPDGLEQEAQEDLLCELNVLDQARHVEQTSIVQNAWARGNRPPAPQLSPVRRRKKRTARR